MKRPPAVEDLLWSWDEEGASPLRSEAAIQLVAWVKTLEQRNAAARMHIARALRVGPNLLSRLGCGEIEVELRAALDVLASEVTA